MNRKDDNELVYEVTRGSISSFEVLIERYQKTIFNMVNKMVGDVETAKDITQDVFVTAFEKMGTFNFNHRFFSWIYRIAVNKTLNHIKLKGLTQPLKELQAGIPAPSPENDEERNRKLVHSGLRELPADQRALLLLKYFCGLSYEEIAVALNVSEKKVKSRLFTSREQLHKIMIGKGFFEND